MSRIILHRAYGSPPARAALMLCKTIDVPVEIKEVNILKGEHRTPEFLKLNPMGTVPVIQDGDFVLAESNAIMKYLLGKYGGAKSEALYPSELCARALADQVMFFNVGVYFPALLKIVSGGFFSGQTGLSEQNIKELERSYGVVEAYLRHREYVAADHMTLADFSVGSLATAMQRIHGLDPKKYPRYAEWLACLESLPVFKEVNEPGVAFLEKIVYRAWETNRNNI